MTKKFRTLCTAMWSVLLVYTLCTVGYLKEVQNDMLAIQADIQAMRETVDSWDETIADLTSEINSLRAEIVELEELIDEMEAATVNYVPEPEVSLTDEEINLIAKVTMAEAEGESEEGKRLVIDTILNRVDSPHSYWPDTVEGVIYQPSQFSAMWDGRINRCRVKDDIVRLVKEEARSRTNTKAVYFRTKRYSSYGTPMFQVGNHYFSSL